MVPHITDAIQDWIERVAHTPVDGRDGVPDVCVIELGGTVGDIESMPFIEALRQFQFRVGAGAWLAAASSWLAGDWLGIAAVCAAAAASAGCAAATLGGAACRGTAGQGRRASIGCRAGRLSAASPVLAPLAPVPLACLQATSAACTSAWCP